ncbi:protein VAC14 homolog [Ischnura elegans]|uniref:protein VAC14 homolog n=1 Tax=Ischnura elegans TaxID=197161 RepID=UPI001ED8AE83|nr:protein VAC14 homolog [Ischnura elegans]
MMSEKDYAPLSAACVRALNDKIYEKRKAAALEIEKMVKEFAACNNTVQIKKLLKVLGRDFACSQNGHVRKGGLIGLAAIAVALGNDTCFYTEELVVPILACLEDTDLRVRYYACESLYNVAKIARGSLLPHLFPRIFDALARLAADPDHNVKSGAELLDRLMKEIVTESGTPFDLASFIPMLRERVYATNAFARQFILSWIGALCSCPSFNLLPFLPDILDGLFRILSDSTPGIRQMCDILLGEFLRSIKHDPSYVDYSSMVNILITHSQAPDDLLQFTAITWIKEFIQLSGETMLPFTASILSATLPCLAYEDDNRKNIRETAKAVNYSFMKLITVTEENNINKKGCGDNEGADATTVSVINSGDNVPSPDHEKGDASAQKLPKGSEKSVNSSALDLELVVEELTKHLSHASVATKVAVLGWIHHLHSCMPHQVLAHLEKGLFPAMIRTLCDPSDEVVRQALKVMAKLISESKGPPLHSQKAVEAEDNTLAPPQVHSGDDLPLSAFVPNPYFSKFIHGLLRLFSSDRSLLEDRGSFIIRQLCSLLNSEAIYRALAEALIVEDDLAFASLMVENLNCILLTSSELFTLRMKLKNLADKEAHELFQCLYACWCHSPVATVALLLLTQNYDVASELISTFGDLDVTVEFLTEIDRLIQLIESPIFTYLRLELLGTKPPGGGCHSSRESLLRALYGLLMLLPQSEAFHTLRRRLQCAPPLWPNCRCGGQFSGPSPGDTVSSNPSHQKSKSSDSKEESHQKRGWLKKDADQLNEDGGEEYSHIDPGLRHFLSVQERHKIEKKVRRLSTVVECGIKLSES